MDRRWFVLAGLFLGRMCMGLQLQSIAALAEPLRATLGFSHTEIGFLIGLFLLSGVIVAFPGTLIGRRFGERRLAPAALLLMAAGSGVGVFATDFITAASGRLLAGVGGIMVNILFTRLVAELFVGHRLNFALAVLMTSWALGVAVAAVVFPLAARVFDWRSTLAALTLFTTMAGFLLVILLARLDGVTPSRPNASPATTRAVQGRGALRPELNATELVIAICAGFAWATFTAGGIIYLSFAPEFLMLEGHSLAGANGITSLIVWSGILAIPLGGWLADRYGIAQPMILYCTLASAICLFLVPLGGPALLLTLLVGIAWGLPPGPYMSILQPAVRPTARAAAYGVYFTLFYGGVGALPAVAGMLRDQTGEAVAPLYLAALVMALSLPPLVAFRVLSPARPPEPRRV